VIIGIGVDMVLISRFDRWQGRAGLLERFFHPRELAAVISRGRASSASLAARFAAKEAYGKALGTGLAGLVLKDIMVRNRENGRPELELFGTALEALRKSGASRTHLSLTHERDHAVAMVVLEGGGNDEL
jgi:holo-[acyl-carrier protein] synthase